MDIDTSLAVLVPIVGGIGLGILILELRAKRKMPTYLDGFLGWVTMVITGFFFEILMHKLNPSYYAQIGDNPMQVVGFSLCLCLSFVVTPLIWFRLRRSTSNKPRTPRQ